MLALSRPPAPARLGVLVVLVATAVGHADLRDEVEIQIRGAGLASAMVAVSVRDAQTGTELVSVNAQRPMIPASNMKLLTSGAALHVLGPDFEFATRLLRDGDRLIVVGDGDPGFGDPALLDLMPAGDHIGIGVETFLDLWVQPVVDAGLTQCTEVVVDDRVFDRTFVHPTWPADQLNRRYCAEVSGLSFHGNVLNFFPRPRAGRRPDLELFRPLSPWLDITNRATTHDGPNDRNDIWIARKQGTNQLTIYGNVKYAYRTPAPVTVHDMPAFFAQLLADRLTRAGVTVGAFGVVEAGAPRPEGQRTGPVIITPIATAIMRCNRDSQNLYAESLLKRMAYALTSEPGSWGTGASIVRHVYHDRVRDSNLATGLIVADGSGLSRDNRVAAATMTAWLDTFHHDPIRGRIFIDSLARAGGPGTLANRFRNTDLHGTSVAAKTGYINYVSCLSGYMTAPDGRRRSFSILVNDLTEPGSVGKAKSMQERILSAVAWDLTAAITGVTE